ncbi:MAG: 50S ribosomal protein L32 [Oligoflexia bacterium]|nr:50S ribosomal protein L32 [Oligoflexia bacterium]
MATPKKKTSVSRKGLRRAGQHHKLYRKFPMLCPNCKGLTMPLMACPCCGRYQDKEVFKISTKEKEATAGSEG